MQYYLQLQYKLLNRRLIDFGLPPWAGYSLACLGFLGGSVYLFLRVDFAPYIYGILALSIVLLHGNVRRNEFLKIGYPGIDYLKIRLLENLAIASPFIAFLCFKQHYLIAGLLLLGSIGAVWLNFSNRIQFTLPTPFSKTPFEFLVGFRSNFGLNLLACFLLIIALQVDNFNLGIFALLLVFLISLGYYGTPEAQFYVWIYQLDARRFLMHKLKTALLHSSILTLPIAVCLVAFYPENWWIILAVLLLGYLYLTCMVFAKYLNFPHKINLAQSIVIGMGFWFPPLLLGIIPFFYTKSLQKLKEILP